MGLMGLAGLGSVVTGVGFAGVAADGVTGAGFSANGSRTVAGGGATGCDGGGGACRCLAGRAVFRFLMELFKSAVSNVFGGIGATGSGAGGGSGTSSATTSGISSSMVTLVCETTGVFGASVGGLAAIGCFRTGGGGAGGAAGVAFCLSTFLISSI